VRQRLISRQPEGVLLVILDATSIGNRWSPDKIAGREKLWADMLHGAAHEIIIAAQRNRTA
jgi:hypothetical protein